MSISIADKALADVTACIGCNDCMLACPLPQSRSISIASLNAAVNESVIEDADVIDFVTACTQCRQCVPACPADLSRADMVLFNKMKVEDQIPDHPLPVQVGPRVETSTWTLDALARELLRLPLFHAVELADVRRMLLTVTLRQMQKGDTLCQPGEYHERLVIVLVGGLEQFSSSPRGLRTRIVSYNPGSFLGEMAVLADQAETFGIAAYLPSIVLEVPKASVRRLMERSGAFSRTMNELYRRRALWTYARSPEVLGELPPKMVEMLFETAELWTLEPEQPVFSEGDSPEDFYLVKAGFIKASRRLPEGERTLTYFREGESFGLIPLLYGEAGQAFDARAASRAQLVKLRGRTLRAALQRFSGAMEALSRGAMRAERVARSPNLSPPVQADRSSIGTHAMPLSPDVLLQMGVAEGREVLVVDQTKCTYCKNCIAACERRHGHSRLQLRGLQVEHLLFPTACRHCEDPKCLLCSVNGIVRRPSGEIGIVEDNCIGCGACAERCPYGNISMHPVEPLERGFLFNLLDLLAGPRERTRALHELDPSRTPQRAVKCDLCADYGDYACVTACPTGAAFRTDPSAKLGAGQLLSGLDKRRQGESVR